MRISAKTDYALRVLLLLAAHQPDLVKMETLTRAEAMPRSFVESILRELVHAGLVHSRRGPEGGYALARPPEQITVGAVLRVVHGPLVSSPRPTYSRHDRIHNDPGPAGRLEEVWAASATSLGTVLDVTTLAHVLTGQFPSTSRAWRARGAGFPRPATSPEGRVPVSGLKGSIQIQSASSLIINDCC